MRARHPSPSSGSWCPMPQQLETLLESPVRAVGAYTGVWVLFPAAATAGAVAACDCMAACSRGRTIQEINH